VGRQRRKRKEVFAGKGVEKPWALISLKDSLEEEQGEEPASHQKLSGIGTDSLEEKTI